MKLLAVIEACDSIILRQCPKSTPQHLPLATDEMAQMHHLRWMLEMCRGFVARDKQDRAYQWVGFVQGYLCRSGYTTIQELQMVDILGHLPDR